MKRRIKTEIFIEYMKKNNLSKREFCKKCGISMYHFNKILSNANNISFIPFFKISVVTKIKVEDMYEMHE